MGVSAQLIMQKDTVQCSIYFHQGKHYFSPNLRDNDKRMREFVEDVFKRSEAPAYTVKMILVNSGASPEGSKRFNDTLSDRRARVIIDYLKNNVNVDESMIMVHSPGVDWDGLGALVKKTDGVPQKDAVLEIIYSEEFGDDDIARRKALEALDRGIPYWWLYRNLFPLVRHSKMTIAYVHKVKDTPLPSMSMACGPKLTAPLTTDITVQTSSEPVKPFYMSVQSNLLYDVATIPNIGVEFYLGSGYSIDANWGYAWWKSDPAHWYYRVYGGDVSVRRWFGREAKEKPLTGHHIGIYGQMLTYDFAFGGLGQIGGVPGGAIWDRANYGVGLEYGYSLPIAKRFNLDFTLGAGYFGGEYQEYLPEDNCYVWQATKRRHWIGPTKAEISLVWLLGRGNYNKGKGGVR